MDSQRFAYEHQVTAERLYSVRQTPCCRDVMNSPADNSSHRLFGIAAAIAAGVCLATGGIGLRWIEAASGWQVLVYRGAALAVVIGL